MIEAGIELDRRIATEVMGWIERETGIGYDTPNGDRTIENSSFGHFQPSTDVASAWEVVEHYKLFEYFDCLTTNEEGQYTFAKFDYVGIWPDYYEFAAETVPLAICKAALWIKDNGSR